MKGIDLFCGCGGLSQGLINSDIDIICAFDNWQPAIDTYKANFNHPVEDVDLSNESNYSIIEKYKVDIIVGGPPCQDFSSAGKRDESLGRADLTIHFANVISLCKPSWFIMENVDRILKSRALSSIKTILKNAGYGLTQVVLNASYCGVPQNRKRFFLIGELNGKDDFLEYYLNKNLQTSPTSVFDYLGNSLGTEFFYRHPRSYQRRAIFSIYEPSPTIRGVNRPIPPKYKYHPGDATTDLSKVRPLTYIERSYLQTFPSCYKFVGKNSTLEQLIGNAVPVKLAEYIGKCFLEYIKVKESGNNLIDIKGQTKLQF